MPAGPSSSSQPFFAGSRVAMEPSPIAVWALTARGCALARQIAAGLGATVFVPEKYALASSERTFQRLASALSENFPVFRQHVCVAASGLVVRCIGPLLRNKTTDPAVVVLDQEGCSVVSLVGGHLGGANDLARKVARLTGGQAVITTATDTAGLPALDLLARESGLVPDRPERFATLAAALLDGRTVQVLDPEDRLWPRLTGMDHGKLFELVHDHAGWRDDRPGVWVSWRRPSPRLAGSAAVLGLHPRCLAAGLGCHRGVGEAAITAFVREVFENNDLAMPSLAVLGTIQGRTTEPGLRSAAAALGVDLHFFSPEQLRTVRTPNPSEIAARLVGTQSVCEAAALLLAGSATLLVSKTKGPDLTLAVALRTGLQGLRE